MVCIVQVRLWKTARTQEEILSSMRKASGLENHSDLIAYWKFNDPDQCVSCIRHAASDETETDCCKDSAQSKLGIRKSQGSESLKRPV